jgi:hypothetical protein
MPITRRVVALSAVALAVLVFAPGSVSAKERVAATITGAGTLVELDAEAAEFQALVIATGARTPLSDPSRLAMARGGNPHELGPMVEIRWHLGHEGVATPGLALREAVHPYATGGPLLKAQPIEGGGPAAWFEVDGSVRTVLARLGVAMPTPGGRIPVGPVGVVVAAIGLLAAVGNRRRVGGVVVDEGGTSS